MNIQIFGTAKSADTRKAQRFFKERGIRFQFVDLKEKEMSRGELRSAAQAVGGVNALLDPACKDRELLILFEYLTPEAAFDKLLERQDAIKQPVVRNGSAATVGYASEVWKGWS